MKPGIKFNITTQRSDDNNWLPDFPNPADFRFNYYKLLQASSSGLAALPENTSKSVAIVGAGCAGMTVARELHRCGFNVTIFEASDRIGGRLYTRDNPNGSSQAGMEMGAMRMPFFSEPGNENSILGYYLNYEAAQSDTSHAAFLTDFPNPGAASGGTGIYINQGKGPDLEYDTPTLIPWPKGEYPDNPELSLLNGKVEEFGNNFSIVANKYYAEDNDNWNICWDAMVNHYTEFSFNDIVVAPALTADEINEKIKLENLSDFDGDLGGFGMTPEQADLLYTIGTGDGSWGAFYNIGALWFLRCTYFGFDSNLRTVEGLTNSDSLPYFGKAVKDAAGKDIKPPNYEGIQSLVEYLYFVPAPGASKSLHESMSAKLFVSESVHRIERESSGQIKISHGDAGKESTFDFVVTSPTQWATQMSIDFVGFDQFMLPQSKVTAEHTQHNISSCKLFFPLKSKYWDSKLHPDNKIPQIMVTDTFIQDSYALSWDSKSDDKGVLLASYTWEDDSLKLLPYDEDQLCSLVLNKLKEITVSTVGQDITEYVDSSKPVYIQWITEPTYIGCSKLYRARNQEGNMIDLSYNQNYAAQSNLYFAGENYSVEGGWTEPALRSGLDCVLQMLNNCSANFKAEGFDFVNDYPLWDGNRYWQIGMNQPQKTAPFSAEPFYTNTTNNIQVRATDNFILSSEPAGIGQTQVDDVLTVTIADQQNTTNTVSYSYDYSHGCSGRITPNDPVNLNEINPEFNQFQGTTVSVEVECKDQCGGVTSASNLYLTLQPQS